MHIITEIHVSGSKTKCALPITVWHLYNNLKKIKFKQCSKTKTKNIVRHTLRRCSRIIVEVWRIRVPKIWFSSFHFYFQNTLIICSAYYHIHALLMSRRFDGIAFVREKPLFQNRLTCISYTWVSKSMGVVVEYRDIYGLPEVLETIFFKCHIRSSNLLPMRPATAKRPFRCSPRTYTVIVYSKNRCKTAKFILHTNRRLLFNFCKSQIIYYY